jgi:hypothetical protein
VVSALAVLVKPGIPLLPILGAFLALGISSQGVRSALTSRATALFCAITVVPVAAYYAYGTVVEGFLRGQAGDKLAPSLLFEPSFWKAWVGRLTDVLGYPGGGLLTESAGVLVLAVAVGTALLTRGPARALLLGLTAGYVAFGTVFTVHIHTHTYYSLLIVPLLGLAMMPLGDALWGWLGKLSPPLRLAIPALLVLALALTGWRARVAYTSEFAASTDRLEEIGRIARHSDSTFVLGQAEMLEYHGWLFGVRWPDTSDLTVSARSLGGREAELTAAGAEARFRRELATRGPFRALRPRYFIVEDVSDLRLQEGLRTYLRANFRAAVRSDSYVLFDLTRRAR